MKKVKLKKKTRIVQIGSLIQQNFGENVTKHGYGVYDVVHSTFNIDSLTLTSFFYHHMVPPKQIINAA